MIPIIFSYFGHIILGRDPFVNVSDPKEVNMVTSDFRFILLYGSLDFLVLASVVVFLIMYFQTKLKAPLMMFFRMLTVAIAATIGGVGDALAGDLGRYYDPFSYIIILIGLLLIYYGFRAKPSQNIA